jgi:hypothetical protein
MNARPLSSTSSRTSRNFNPDTIEDGKLIAFDAEFVSVQAEEAALNEPSGLKMILRETRHAVGRISIIYAPLVGNRAAPTFVIPGSDNSH